MERRAPIVSCLCVSRPERWGSLQRAIIDFIRQSYWTAELIIAVGTDDYLGLIQSFLATLKYETTASERPLLGTGDIVNEDRINLSVHAFKRPVRNQLDGLTFAMCQARGDIITLWDDDNANHPNRLAEQVVMQQRYPQALTAMSESLYYFHDSAELFVVNYANATATAAERVAVSTLMGFREHFPATTIEYRSRPAEQMVNGLAKNGGRLIPVPAMPAAHLVGVTRDNLRKYDTHRRLAETRSQPRAWLMANEAMIRERLAKYRWDAPDIDVSGSDGVAFTIKSTERWSDQLYPINTGSDQIDVVNENTGGR